MGNSVTGMPGAPVVLLNRAVNSRKIIPNWHDKQALPVASLCPKVAHHLLLFRILGKVLALVFHNQNAAVGQHGYEVGVKASA